MTDMVMTAGEATRMKEILTGSRRPVIIAHVGPDGDAVGSSVALWHILSGMGKDAHVMLPDSIPPTLSFLDGTERIKVFSENREENKVLLDSADLIVCLDFNDSKRTDSMQEYLLAATARKIMIDHHLYPQPFCELTVSRPEISSTSLLLYKVLMQLGWRDKIEKRAASAIYMGMMTDTGNFSYNSNDPSIYTAISDLLKAGIDKDYIYNKACNTFSADRMRLCAYAVYEKMELFPGGAAMISLSRNELNTYHYVKGDTEGLVNEPLAIDGIKMSVFLREEKDMIKVSLRSKGDFAVNVIASEHFNGGGHKNAAGGEFFGTLEAACEKFREILPRYINTEKDGKNLQKSES